MNTLAKESLNQIGVKAGAYYGLRKSAEIADNMTQETIEHLQNQAFTVIPQQITHWKGLVREMQIGEEVYLGSSTEAKSNGDAAVERLYGQAEGLSVRIVKLIGRLGQFEIASAEAAEHYHRHEGEYYQLAVIEAHLQGVELNLETPVVIGDSTEV